MSVTMLPLEDTGAGGRGARAGRGAGRGAGGAGGRGARSGKGFQSIEDALPEKFQSQIAKIEELSDTEEDKAKQARGGVQLVRLSFPPTIDVDAVCERIESAVATVYGGVEVAGLPRLWARPWLQLVLGGPVWSGRFF